jgi:hypothetical protein
VLEPLTVPLGALKVVVPLLAVKFALRVIFPPGALKLIFPEDEVTPPFTIKLSGLPAVSETSPVALIPEVPTVSGLFAVRVTFLPVPPALTAWSPPIWELLEGSCEVVSGKFGVIIAP